VKSENLKTGRNFVVKKRNAWRGGVRGVLKGNFAGLLWEVGRMMMELVPVGSV
jgi:hypothetical protein